MSRHTLLILLAFMLYGAGTSAQAKLSKTIYFKPGQYKLDSVQAQAIDAMLKDFGGKQPGFLKVFGYADTVGTEAYNDRLSDLRANEVFNYIRSRLRIDEKRVYVTSLGESTDVYDLHFPDAHPQQRCVDIWFER